MPNRVNQLLVRDYKKRFDGVMNFVSVGYEGMNYADQGTMRNQIAAAGFDFFFVKNRLADLALRELGRPSVRGICSGQTAFAYGEDPVAIARFFVEFRKKNEALKIHGAVVEDTILDENAVVALSKSPSKEELKGQIAGQALSPGSKLAGALMGPARTIAGQLKARIEELEESA